MQYQARWTTPSVRHIDSTPPAARLDRLYGAARRMAIAIADFHRELDRGWAVMRGERRPDRPSPAELDTLARTRVVRLPYEEDV